MGETIDQKIFEEIEEGLKRINLNGVIIIKKSSIPQRGTTNLMKSIVDYLEGRGYDTIPREDNEQYHISFILKPF